MSFDQDKAFEVCDGIIIEDAAGVFSGSVSPIGTAAPQGSIYLRSNGEHWKKNGPLDADWILIESGGSGSPNVEGGNASSIYTADQCLDGGNSGT